MMRNLDQADAFDIGLWKVERGLVIELVSQKLVRLKANVAGVR